MPLIKRYHLEPATLEASEAEAATCPRADIAAETSCGELEAGVPALSVLRGVTGIHPPRSMPVMDRRLSPR